MIDVVTVSSKGQVVLPRIVREEIKLKKKDKLLVISDRERIILEKISEREAREKLPSLLDMMAEEFKASGITRADVQNEVEAVRHEARIRHQRAHIGHRLERK